MGGVAMPTFIMLTRLSPDSVRSPRGLEQLERQAMQAIRQECPGVEWLGSYAVLGPCDYLDVFLADGIETAARVSALIRTFGHAQTEIWAATEWDRFNGIGSRRSFARFRGRPDHGRSLQEPIKGVALERPAAKYGNRGRGYVYMEAGHAAESLILQASRLALPRQSSGHSTTGR